MKQEIVLCLIMILAALAASGCASQSAEAMLASDLNPQVVQAASEDGSGETLSSVARSFTLQADLVDGRMVYVGAGGEIDGLVNPELIVRPGDAVQLILINRNSMPHDLSIPDLQIQTPLISTKGAATDVSFVVADNQEGIYSYFCTVAGHRQAGMEGRLIIK